MVICNLKGGIDIGDGCLYFALSGWWHMALLHRLELNGELLQLLFTTTAMVVVHCQCQLQSQPQRIGSYRDSAVGGALAVQWYTRVGAEYQWHAA